MAFLDELSRLSQGNFLGGLASLGQNLKEQEQNEFLVSQYEKFKQERDNVLKTTNEQISELTQVAITDKDKKETSPEVNAAFNMLKAYEKMQTLTDTYTPFITSFAALNTAEGTNVANMLTKDLATQMGIIEKKIDAPFKQLEYDQLKTTLEKDKFQLQKMQADKLLMDESNQVADWLVKSGTLAQYIPDGEIETANDKLWKELTLKEKIVQDLISKQFPNLSQGAITAGYSLAMSRTGRSLKYSDVSKIVGSMRQGNQWSGYTPMEVQTYASFLRGWSSEWYNMPTETRKKLKDYMSGKQISFTDESEQKWYESKAEIYKSNGLYQQYHDALSMIPGGGFMRKKKITLKTETGIGQEFEVPSDDGIIAGVLGSDTQDIIRMFGSDAFVNESYDYNGYSIRNFRNALRNKTDQGSLFNQGQPINTFDYLEQSVIKNDWKFGKE